MTTRLFILSLLVAFLLPEATASYLTPRPVAQTQERASEEPDAPEPARTQADSTAPEAGDGQNQSPSYRLILRDQVQMTVYGQPDLTVAQRIDGQGKIRIPLLGNVIIAGKTVRELEQELEAAFVEREFLRSPMVTVRVTEYAPREITVFGAVRSPGTFPLPIELNSMDIVEVISKVGGFTPVARTREVRVVRNRGQPDERVEIVNVDNMIAGQSRGGQRQAQIYPGDLIQVNQSLF